jgi:tetratricopeptide (TPR) repeat protein
MQPARFFFPTMRFIAALLLSLWAIPTSASAQPAAKDAAERFFETRLKSDPEDFIAANQFVDRLMARFRREGRLDALRRADEVSVQSLAAVPGELNPGGLAARARVLTALHRFAEARDLAQQWAAQQPQQDGAHLLLGDAQLELGEIGGARQAWAALSPEIAESAAVLGRKARMAWLLGEREEALALLDKALAAAREEADPQTLAWALVRRGHHAFRTGDWDAAARDYREAAQVAPEEWTVREHLAELHAAQGRDEEAVAALTQLAESTGRPEAWQALGDFHAFQKRPDAAAAAFEKARSGYMESIERGEVLYLHHLAGFFADSLPDYEAAVKWAHEDLKLRATPHAQAALAWALYRAGKTGEAAAAMEKALHGGAPDPHVMYQAGMIFLSAGEIARGNSLLRQCAAINPYFAAFHFHR